MAVRYGTLIPCVLPLAIKLVMMTPIGWKDFLGVREKDLWLPESLNKVWVRQVQRLLIGNKSFTEVCVYSTHKVSKKVNNKYHFASRDFILL